MKKCLLSNESTPLKGLAYIAGVICMYIYVWLLAFLACLDLTGRLLLSGCPPLGEVA